MVFDKAWFNQHQYKLVWLLNSRLTKRWFRWVMCIDNKEVINRIEPNAYWFGAKQKGDKIEVSADFRTHAKYAKRLYYAFKPLWWIIHFWDWILADWLIPQWSYGFSTLTAFPDADPETNTVDGVTVGGNGSDVSWATLVSASGDNFSDASQFMTLAAWLTGVAVNTYQTIQRFICLFDTSSLTAGVTVSSAVLSVWGRGKEDGGSNANVTFNVYSSNPASNTGLANSDFSSLGSTPYATGVSYASFDGTNTVYTDFTLNATGIAAISKTGISKFGFRESTYDVGNTAPTWVNNLFTRALILGAENAGTSSDPKLVVTYAISSATSSSPIPTLLLMGVG